MDNQVNKQPSAGLSPVPQPILPKDQPTQTTTKTTNNNQIILFGIIAFLIVLLVISFISQSSKINRLQKQVKTLSTTHIVANNNSLDYLYLYKFNFKIPLTSNMLDLYYTDYKNPAGYDQLSFSTQSLANASPSCLAAPVDGNTYSYQSSTVTNKTVPNTINAVPLGLVTVASTQLSNKEVGSGDNSIGINIGRQSGKFLYYKSPQSACSDNSFAMTLQHSQKSIFMMLIREARPINQ